MNGVGRYSGPSKKVVRRCSVGIEVPETRSVDDTLG